MTREAPPEITALAGRIERALAADFAELTGPEGWELTGVSAGFFQIWRVLIELRAGDRTLGFLVSPTAPEERAYRKTPRFDFVYFSEDVPDPEQDRIYARDRASIDRFAAWLDAWDRASGDRA